MSQLIPEVLYKALIKLLCVVKDTVGSNGSIRPRKVFLKIFKAIRRDCKGFGAEFCFDGVIITFKEAIKWKLTPDANPFFPGIAFFNCTTVK